MDVGTNFSLQFTHASESKAGMPERLLKQHVLERTVTGLCLISQALGFSNLRDADHSERASANLNDLPGRSFVAMVAGTSALLVGTALIIAAFLY